MTYSEFRNQFSDTWRFRNAYGSLTYEEAKAMIDAETCPPGDKAAMIDAWREARRIVKLKNIGVFYSERRGLEITFNEYDSEFSGNDFEYIYRLDVENTDKFLKMIPHEWEDPKINIQEWMIKNIEYLGRGLELQKKWIEMGLYVACADLEDYPGGINHRGFFYQGCYDAKSEEDLDIKKDDVRGACKYYGLFSGSPDTMITDEFILRTDDPDEYVLLYDFTEGQWVEIDRDILSQYADSSEYQGELSEMSEQNALWYLEQHHAFSGKGDDEKVAAFLADWAEKKEQYREEWKNGKNWRAKYVETCFCLKGRQYSITPDSIGLEKGEREEEGFMEFLQRDMGEDLKELGATEIRHMGFLD